MGEALCKRCRVEGEKLFIKGERCYSARCPVVLKSYSPGKTAGRGRGRGRRRARLSEYGEQLKAKQQVKKMYGVLERQFRNYFRKAAKSKGVTGETLLRFLEQRLDNVVFRLGFAASRSNARQLVSHGHIRVNNKKTNIPSYQIKVKDKISFSPKFKKHEIYKQLQEKLGSEKPLSWLGLDTKTLEGTVLREPQRDDIDANIKENLIVEYYSR